MPTRALSSGPSRIAAAREALRDRREEPLAARGRLAVLTSVVDV